MSDPPDLILVRHGEVDAAWKGICYGAMDVPLSEWGAYRSVELARLLCQRWQPSKIYHSGLTRTRFLADALMQASEIPVRIHEDVRLQERNFGKWQGITWDEAYASDSENFHGLIEHPDSYSPPSGETTSQMQSRAVAWFNECLPDFTKNTTRPIVAISHSGPIAAIAGHVLQLHARNWQPWTIQTLECVILNLAQAQQPTLTRLAFESLSGKQQ